MDLIQELAQLVSAGTPCVLATVVDAQGSAPRGIGSKMIVLADGSIRGSVGGGTLEAEAIRDAQEVLRTGAPAKKRYLLSAKKNQACGGAVEVFLEPQVPAAQALIFGAGHVGQALAHVLSATDFGVAVVDGRPEFARPDRFPPGVRIIARPPIEALEAAPGPPERTYVVILTHDHSLDEEIAAVCIRRPYRFVGMIGSDAKARQFHRNLAARGHSEAEIGRLICPIGLPLGGKLPGDIAVSIAAQLISLRHSASPEGAAS